MAEFIKISDIAIPADRSRALDKNYSIVLADGLERDGLFHPIQVRRTPNAKGGKFTLVSGLHRLDAARNLGWAEIEAKIVEANATEALRLEIEENLRRYDLTVLDRAHAVVEMRRLWEEENGPIEHGGDRRSKDQVDPLNDGDREVGTFLASAADRIGVSEPAIKRLTFIAQKLVPELRVGLHGRAEADNQSALMNAAKCAPKHQKAAAVKLKAEPALSLAEALEATTDMPKPARDEQTVFYSRAYDTFHRMSPPNRKKLLIELGVPEDIAAKISRRKAKGGDDA